MFDRSSVSSWCFRFVLPTLLVAGVALPAAADQDPGWTLRFGAVWMEPDLDFVAEDGSARVTSSGALGLGASAEYRFNRRLGLEGGVFTASPDLELRAEVAAQEVVASDTLQTTAAFAGLNLHLTPERSVDVYAGPLLAYVSYGDPEFTVTALGVAATAAFTSDNDVGWGAQLGADVPLGERWLFNASLRYLDTTLEVSDEGGEVTSLGFDPLVATLGLGFSF